MILYSLFLVISIGTITAFYYSDQKCPDIEHVHVKPGKLLDGFWKEYMKYTYENPEDKGIYKEMCSFYRTQFSENYLEYMTHRIVGDVFVTYLDLFSTITFYNKTDFGAFRVAPVVTKNEHLTYPKTVNTSIPYLIQNNLQTKTYREDYDMRVIFFEENLLVLWGCDQINKEISRRSLKVLCETYYDCELTHQNLSALIKDKIGDVTEMEKVHHGELCEEIQTLPDLQVLPYRLRKNCAQFEKFHFHFVGFAVAIFFIVVFALN